MTVIWLRMCVATVVILPFVPRMPRPVYKSGDWKLLALSGLFLMSYRSMMTADIGFANRDTLSMNLALHGSRLRMMLEKTTDTTVRGVIYEGTGTVRPEVLAQGREEMAHAQRTNEIPYETLEADPRGDRDVWLGDVVGAIDRLLAGPRRVAGLRLERARPAARLGVAGTQARPGPAAPERP